MSQSKSPSREITGEEYLRQCTLRNPAFRKEQKEFSNRWNSQTLLFTEPSIVARKKRGQPIEAFMEEEQRKQGRYLREVIEFHHRWPTINPDDVQGAASSSPPGPKVRLAPYSPTYWPRDGSVLLSVHSTATGDEVKRGWREIKRGLRLNQRRVRI